MSKRVAVIAALVEGNGLRATARMTSVARATVEKLLRDLGNVCAMYQHVVMRNLPCTKIQVDEIWNFVYGEAEERRECEGRARARGRHLDVGCYRRRYQARPLLACRRA